MNKYRHKHIQGLTCEIIEPTKKGYKVKETQEYSGRKSSTTKTAYYCNLDFSQEKGFWVEIPMLERKEEIIHGLKKEFYLLRIYLDFCDWQSEWENNHHYRQFNTREEYRDTFQQDRSIFIKEAAEKYNVPEDIVLEGIK